MKVKVGHDDRMVFSGIVKDLSPKWEEFYHDSATSMGDAIVTYNYCRHMDAYEAASIEAYDAMGLNDWSKKYVPSFTYSFRN